MAALFVVEGQISVAGPRLATAIEIWVQAGDRGQLWTTLHHVAALFMKAGHRELALDVWNELRDRVGYASQVQRSDLQAQLGEPGEPTRSDAVRR